MSFYLHPQGICESTQVGEDTRIWAFAHVLSGARIGRNCNICDHVFIENDVVIGDNVTIKSGVQVWDGLRVADNVFIGPNVTFSNDKMPRSKQYQAVIPQTHIEAWASLGANSTILPDLRIGRAAVIGAGSVVTANVPPYAIVMGNPGRITGYIESDSGKRARPIQVGMEKTDQITELPVEGVKLHRLFTAQDLRGKLAVSEFGKDLPFTPKRMFTVYEVPSQYVRGEHAHRVCHQFLIAAHGSIMVVVDNGHHRAEVELSNPSQGLHVPPMIWATQYRYSPGSVLLVLASENYDEADYIRNYEVFLREKGLSTEETGG